MNAPTKTTEQDSNPFAFEFLCQIKGPFVTPKQAAEAFGRGETYVYGMIEEGQLEAHAPVGREKKRYKITKRSVLMHLMQTALYQPSEFGRCMEAFINTLTRDQLTRLITQASSRSYQLHEAETRR